ncbi:MAG TPA: FliM/FliN family flagellar motor switch protein [Planctomycetaceae bacterium]|jgi:flagellar motor switch protein FliN/FliY|nr:FliM/FliN family flagellar motor switch protein [Planctomycetaceae bacterium]
MAQLTAEQIQRTIEACRAHLAEMGETFRANLDCDVRLSAAEPRPYAADAVSAFEGPGLAVSLVLGEQGLLLLIPEPIPLPAWYRQPGISENNRLQTFAHELSLQLLPADLQADRYSARAAASLKEFAEQAQIDPTATAIDLAVFYADAAESDPPIATILMIMPIEALAAEGLDGATVAGEAESTEASTEPSAEAAEENRFDFPDDDADEATFAQDQDQDQDGQQVSANTGLSLDQALRALRVLNVPVTVSVRLAERKMSLGQIVALAPGGLITFSKSCEDLLDLFVNNHRYCQGEAIKIGENFGLKVAKVGVTEARKDHVL